MNLNIDLQGSNPNENLLNYKRMNKLINKEEFYKNYLQQFLKFSESFFEICLFLPNCDLRQLYKKSWRNIWFTPNISKFMNEN